MPQVEVVISFNSRLSLRLLRVAPLLQYQVVGGGVVLSYCGVPVMDPEGELLGTLCHYDLVPRDPEQVDLELMLQVASRPGDMQTLLTAYTKA